jgi:uncharacterized protein
MGKPLKSGKLAAPSQHCQLVSQLFARKALKMFKTSVHKYAGKWLLAAALAGFAAAALAQAEPTLNQVYETANAGKLEQAQVMMQQVLVAHPGSAKAHFVQAELFAKQGQLGRAREALATAEKLSPGLVFAKPDALQNLRAQLAAKNNAPALNPSNNRPAAGYAAPAAVAPASPFPWGMALMGGGALIAFGIFMLRKKNDGAQTFSPASAQPAGYGNAGGLGGPQGFGMGNNPAPAYGQPGYGQPGYGQPGYGQPAGMGLGSKVAGGLAAGLAVGAGVMAAQAIGRSLSGNNEHDHNQATAGNTANNDYVPFAGNNDLGGQNFGVNDSGSWDDSSAVADSGGGGDWDS